MRGEIGCQYPTEALFGRSGRRTVVVGQIEVRDAMVEGLEDHFSCVVLRAMSPEVLPQAERYPWQQQPASAAAGVSHVLVTIRCRVVHDGSEMTLAGRRPASPFRQGIENEPGRYEAR